MSLANLARVDLGVERAGLSLFRIAPILNGYTPPRALALYAQIEDALQQTPGVVAVSGATVRLLDDTNSSTNMTVTGFTAGPDANTNASFTNVGSRYFSTLGIPLVAGREFTDADTDATRPVAIVNEAFVRKFRLGANARRRPAGHDRRPAAGHRDRRRRRRRRVSQCPRHAAAAVLPAVPPDRGRHVVVLRAHGARRRPVGAHGRHSGNRPPLRSQSAGRRPADDGRAVRREHDFGAHRHDAGRRRSPRWPPCSPASASTPSSPIPCRSACAKSASAWRWAPAAATCA